MRVGLFAKKIGMTRIFDEFGSHIPVTVLECPESVVTNSGHNAENRVQIASFDVKAKSLNKAQNAQYKKLKTASKKYVAEYKVKDASQYKPGQIIDLNHFIEGQFIDIRGRNIGKGFAGAMKRHGFGGLEASHGISISHRSHGSTGQCQDPGRVFKGKKMAGHMGSVNIAVQNVEIVKIDVENSLIFVRGSVPGKKGAVLKLSDAVKKALPESVPMPAGFKGLKKEGEEKQDAEADAKQEVAPQAVTKEEAPKQEVKEETKPEEKAEAKPEEKAEAPKKEADVSEEKSDKGENEQQEEKK